MAVGSQQHREAWYRGVVQFGEQARPQVVQYQQRGNPASIMNNGRHEANHRLERRLQASMFDIQIELGDEHFIATERERLAEVVAIGLVLQVGFVDGSGPIG